MSAPVAAPGQPQAVWVNGRESHTVSALERGLHYGDGLFETIACLDGQPRFLERHLRRLAAGAARLALPLPDPQLLAGELRMLAAGAARAILKLVITRGTALARGYALTGHEAPTRIALRYPWPEEDARLGHDGVRVRIAALRLGENPALAGLKHCNRLEQVLARREWTDPDITEGLLFSSSGLLVGGTACNVFLVHGGRLLTPSIDRCGVAGIMREVVLEAARSNAIGAEEGALGAQHLAAAQELFLTNALIGIRPVRELAGRQLGAGELTRRLQAQLAPLLAPAGAGVARD